VLVLNCYSLACGRGASYAHVFPYFQPHESRA
jgi:hypothetical protein